MDRNKTPLIEYPRPQLVRSSYLCLNGEWEYAIRKDKKVPDTFDGKIMVPFHQKQSFQVLIKFYILMKDYIIV